MVDGDVAVGVAILSLVALVALNCAVLDGEVAGGVVDVEGELRSNGEVVGVVSVEL